LRPALVASTVEPCRHALTSRR